MNTQEVAAALSGVRASSSGVYAADRIPRALSLPAAIVTNMDPANKPGSHWVAFYIDNNGFGTYFDSYGLPPESPHHIDRLKRNCTRYQWNKKKLQSYNSKVCGEYCVAFLHHMCRHLSLRSFCDLFTRDSLRNDNLVAKFYKLIVKKNRNRSRLAHSMLRENCTGRGGAQSCSNKMYSKFMYP